MDVYVISWNLSRWPERLCDQLSAAGLTPVVLDNASTEPACRWWLDRTPYHVVRLAENMGMWAPWLSGLADAAPGEFYAVTDHDLDLAGVPADWPERLTDLLRRYPHVRRAGLGLRTADLPGGLWSPMSEFFEACEKLDGRRREVEPGVWEAQQFQIGVYRRGATVEDALPDAAGRTLKLVGDGERYCARHLPWYQTHADCDPEFRRYLDLVPTTPDFTPTDRAPNTGYSARIRWLFEQFEKKAGVRVGSRRCRKALAARRPR